MQRTAVRSRRQPSRYLDTAPLHHVGDDPGRDCPSLQQIVPTDPNVPYDMKLVIREVLDARDFFEVHGAWARNIVVGDKLARSPGFAKIDPYW